MKIIARTATGYLCEIAPEEVRSITGDSDHYSYSNTMFKPGDVFEVSKTWGHLQHLLANEKERQRIAESLRAAATLIENTPSPVTLPPEPSPGEI